MRPRCVAGHGHLLAGSDLHHAAVVVLGVLAVPEVVEVGDERVVVEVVLRGRRRDAPFEAATVPWIGARRRQRGGLALGTHDVDEEHHERQGDQEGADGRHHVPEVEAVAVPVGVDAPAHALEAEDVHRAEGQVEADEREPEVDLPEALVQEVAEDLRPPEVEAAQEPEQRAAEDDVVEVGDDVIGVGLLGVRRCDGVGDARQPADGEHGDQADREQHRCGEAQLPAPHRGQPVQDLHASGHGDEHR